MTTDRFYIQQQLIDTETGQCLSTEPRTCHENEVPWVRDQRLHAQVAWADFLNRNPICAVPYLNKEQP